MAKTSGSARGFKNSNGEAGSYREELLELARKLYDRGFNIVPGDREKKPLGKWSPEEMLFEWRKIEWAIRSGRATGLAIVAGPENPFKEVGTVLIILDIDDPRALDRLDEERREWFWELINKTVHWKTGPRCPKCWGKHGITCSEGICKCPSCNIEFRLEDAPRGLAALFYADKDVVEKLGGAVRRGPVELVVNNYQLLPPSLHPSGARYEWGKKFDYEKPNHGIYSLSPEELERLYEIVRELRGDKREAGVGARGAAVAEARRGARVVREERRLSEEERNRIAKLLLPFYVEGHRNNIVFSLLGLFVKNGVDYESAKRVVELLATMADDEEIERRLYLVDYHYERRVEVVGIERLKGVSGLREELEAVARELGYSEEEATRRVSEVIAELYAILGVKRGRGVAWLERVGGFVTAWVAVGKQGIYLYRRSREGEEPKVRIISNAVISEVKIVKIEGLDIRNIYSVRVEDNVYKGELEEVVREIERKHGLDGRHRYALMRLIEFMAEEEERLYYSPGPWVVTGEDGSKRIVFVEEPGYTPEWKPYIVWRPPRAPADERLVREALEAIKRFVEAYRDSSKPSLILSYVPVACIAHHVKNVVGIVPHVIIHGREKSGKSALLDMVKAILGITWNDPEPRSDYQARVLLSASTLPAVVDEIGGLLGGYAREDRSSIAAIELLHRATTQTMLRVSGGSSYAGIFLAVRSMIAATNASVDLVPWQADKFILVEISREHGIDSSKARGYTVRTMKEEVLRALPSVGVELLKEVEGLLPELDKLRGLPREEIIRSLVKLGYEAWRRLYQRYGLEPFPEPADVNVEEEKSGVEEQYRAILESYIIKCDTMHIRDALSNPGECFAVIKEVDESKLGELDTEMWFDKEMVLLVKKEDGSRELLCKIPFLTRFGEWVSENFGLPQLGYRRLAEILGLRKTARKIGSKTYDNIYAGSVLERGRLDE